MTTADTDGLTQPHTEVERLAVELGLLEDQTDLACSDLPGHVWLELEEALRTARILVLDERLDAYPAQLTTLQLLTDTYLPAVISSCGPLSELPMLERDALTREIEQETRSITHYLNALQAGLAEGNDAQATQQGKTLRDFFGEI